MADGKIKVSVEGVVHTTLAELAQTLVNEYGIRIKTVTFSWDGIEIFGETAKWSVRSVVIDSEKRF